MSALSAEKVKANAISCSRYSFCNTKPQLSHHKKINHLFHQSHEVLSSMALQDILHVLIYRNGELSLWQRNSSHQYDEIAKQDTAAKGHGYELV